MGDKVKYFKERLFILSWLGLDYISIKVYKEYEYYKFNKLSYGNWEERWFFGLIWLLDL